MKVSGELKGRWEEGMRLRVEPESPCIELL